jgi:two-component system response regulator FixJ
MSDLQTVHIVDDDSALRDSLAFLLGAEGFATRLYESGPALLAVAKGMPHHGCAHARNDWNRVDAPAQ